MNQKVKELCIWIYNLKNGPFWKKGSITVNKEGRDILLNKVKIVSNGNGNKLYLGDGVRLHNVTFHISGNNNTVRIDEGCSICDSIFCTEEDNNLIWLKQGTTTTGGVSCSAIEGTKLIVGEDGMISKDVYIATGDGHGVVDNSRKRTNYSMDITIGDHVWIGYRTIINKGCVIPNNTVIAAGSVVSKKINTEIASGCAIGGNPAKIIKRNLNWTRNRKDGENVR